MQYPKELLFDITVLLETVCPERLLIIGESLFSLSDDYQRQCQLIKKTCKITKVSASIGISNFSLSTRYDLAILGGLLENNLQIENEQLIARLRDLYTPRLILIADLEKTDWQENDLFGLGFNRFTPIKNLENSNSKANFVVYQYNIDCYKRTPDWFNPKNWANPNLWNKFWW